MYTPKFNQLSDRALLIEAMRAWSFAILIGPPPAPESAAPLAATHLPLVVKDEGAHGLLEGHFARANPHWKALAGRETLVVFAGPHSYVSPALYADPLSVPTWNYIAVHAYGTLELVEEEAGKDALLKGLIGVHDPAFAEKWRAMPSDFRRAESPALLRSGWVLDALDARRLAALGTGGCGTRIRGLALLSLHHARSRGISSAPVGASRSAPGLKARGSA
jgi:transcriptional regulator